MSTMVITAIKKRKHQGLAEIHLQVLTDLLKRSKNNNN